MEYLQYQTEASYMTIVQYVLNLVINGIPSIPNQVLLYEFLFFVVLNLVINGIPSILSNVDKDFQASKF